MALAVYHWLFLAQPDGLPEAMIGANPDDYLRRTIDGWCADPDAIDPAAFDRIPALLQETRRHPCRLRGLPGGRRDRPAARRGRPGGGRRITCPVLALWASHGTDGRPYDAMEVWRRWADDVTGREIRWRTLPAGGSARRRWCVAAELPRSEARCMTGNNDTAREPSDVTNDIESREKYRHFLAIPTRWMDNDIYGHVNNVVYYSYFDTVINEYLIDGRRLRHPRGDGHWRRRRNDVQVQEIAGFPGDHRCRATGRETGEFQRSLRSRIVCCGRSEPAATGHFVHVFVERATMRRFRSPSPLRACMERLLVS